MWVKDCLCSSVSHNNAGILNRSDNFDCDISKAKEPRTHGEKQKEKAKSKKWENEKNKSSFTLSIWRFLYLNETCLELSTYSFHLFFNSSLLPYASLHEALQVSIFDLLKNTCNIKVHVYAKFQINCSFYSVQFIDIYRATLSYNSKKKHFILFTFFNFWNVRS